MKAFALAQCLCLNLAGAVDSDSRPRAQSVNFVAIAQGYSARWRKWHCLG